MPINTNGWTIVQWREVQKSSQRYEAVKRLLNVTKGMLENGWEYVASQHEILTEMNNIYATENCQDLPLYGVPFSILYDGTDLSDASVQEKNHVVDLLKKSGAIIIARTKSDRVENSHSCDSLCAVKQGAVPFCLGMHIAGIMPENLSKLVSLKLPSDVLTSMHQDVNEKPEESLSVYSVTLSDVKLIYALISASEKAFPLKMRRTFGLHPKFAIPEQSLFLHEGLLDTFKELGCEVLSKDFSDLYKLISCLRHGPWIPERYAEVKEAIKNRTNAVEDSVLEMLSRAEQKSSSELVKWIRKDVQKTFDSNLYNFDGFIIPIIPADHSAPEYEQRKHGTFSEFINFSDFSAISIPTSISHNGVSCGIALISKKCNEYALFDIAFRFLTIEGLLTPSAMEINDESFIHNVSFNKSLSQLNMSNEISKMYVTEKKKPFDTVLIANRGEIAVRIIRTLKRMGIKSVAIFSDQDRYSQHVLDADESYYLEGSTLASSYLNISKIIMAAKNTNSDAIIPGYGFLSENAEFAEACKNSGVVFVGPSAECILALGMKHSARRIAAQAKVPLVPGSELLETLEDALKVAAELGYPLMIKSTAGGGGIGLERVNNEEELIKSYESVRRLGQSYFNESGVFLERYVDNARHVEVQIFGDGKGNAVALGERDCSLQRRNQKIIEETPAPDISPETVLQIRNAAVMLAKTLKYKCAGTVEFIYDHARNMFYFLEVNTRLQVEHPVTEEITGLDLVEWMLLIAADTPPDFNQKIELKGSSMEARLYAENPVKGFLPSPGLLTEVSFPTYARVDTWIQKGTEVTADFDPLLAKIIVHGKDRHEALNKLCRALDDTVVHGIVTNIDYLRSVAKSEFFRTAAVSTLLLDRHSYVPQAVEILFPGSYTTIQDYPGRTGLWHIGVPPSGPMDDYAFQLANRIVGNDSTAPAIEITLIGPKILFYSDAIISLTGGSSEATLDNEAIKLWTPITVKAGQKLDVGKLTSGCRSYLAIRGGFDVPLYLGSRSTFALGNMGGFNGRVLKFGDVIFLGRSDISSCTIRPPKYTPVSVPESLIPCYPKKWEVGVLSGPHGSPDFFTPECIKNFLTSEWKVHYNSNRFGVRLIGPKPEWARIDGGEAGLHPSNTHDYVYGIGAINFTGDDPVILTCDGPSLGGFVCPFTVAEAEMWKIGQVKPGDSLKFRIMSHTDALKYKRIQTENIENASGTVLEHIPDAECDNPVLYSQEPKENRPGIVYRQVGDRYILIEYGENIFDIKFTIRIYELMKNVEAKKLSGIVEMSPGVRSVLIEYDGLVLSQQKLIELLSSIDLELCVTRDWRVQARKLRLPLAFEDDATLAAVDRYRETIRSEAPWLPNNVDFIQKINHMNDRNEVRDIMFKAKFMVLGLGDVFLGAPCAIPLDPRHRLVGTKYNPSRTFTPNGTVGLGGMYMCIYTMESPGGYQLVGRTVPIWDKLTLGQDRPWLLSIFDQIEYYPVTQQELAKLTLEAQHGFFKFDITNCEFDFGAYQNWLDDNAEDIQKYTSRLMDGVEEMARLIKIANVYQSEPERCEETMEDFGEDATLVYCEFVGRVWKELVKVGDEVKEGQALIVVEAMKAEMTVAAPSSGQVLKVSVKCGDFVEAGDVVVILS